MSPFSQLFLVRHGESTGNVDGLFLGVTDTPLTKRGRDQATNLAHFFKSQNIGFIYSSPLQRTRATAKYIAEAVDVKPSLDVRLIEQNFGSWDGVPLTQIKSQHQRHFDDWQRGNTAHRPGRMSNSAENSEGLGVGLGEGLEDVMARIRPFFQPFLEPPMNHALKEKSAIVVAHGGVIQTALCFFLNTPMRNIWPYFPPPGSISTLQLGRLEPVLVELGRYP